MKFIQSLKAHLLKVTLTIAATLLLVEYWLHVGSEPRHFEPLFRMKVLETENVTVFSPSTDPVEEFSYNTSSSHNSSEITNTTLTHEPIVCPPVPPNLNGPVNIIRTYKEFSELAEEFPELGTGGKFAPKECKARSVVALVIPYRDRPQQLSIFLNNIHRLLMKQQIDYQIFVIEQKGDDPFNRGKLMNVGFTEALKVRDFACFIFHDVDLIPEDDRNLYTCPEQPRHMSVAIDKFRYKLPYKEIFGGACALSKEHFMLSNGFSNLFWGWGGEDDDMYSRIRRKGLHVSRYPFPIAKYTMLPHSRQTPNPKRFQIMQQGKKLYETDGLSDLDYTRISIEFRRLYTWILVDLHPPR